MKEEVLIRTDNYDAFKYDFGYAGIANTKVK